MVSQTLYLNVFTIFNLLKIQLSILRLRLIRVRESKKHLVNIDKFYRNVTLLPLVCQVWTVEFRFIFIRVGALMQNMKTSLYSQAHLIVSAIRVYEHLNSRPPTVDDVCRIIDFSVEQGHFICRKLQTIGIIKAVEGSYGTRLFINDHLKLEDLPRGEPENRLEDDLKKFKDTRKAFSRKIESFQAQQKQKKKDLFAEMEKKLKEELEKK